MPAGGARLTAYPPGPKSTGRRPPPDQTIHTDGREQTTMGETIWPGEYRRKVTSCKAMRVTSENLPQVAAWCGGHIWASSVVVPIWSDGKRGEDTAPIGSWVVQVGLAFQVWPHEHFTAQWQAVTP